MYSIRILKNNVYLIGLIAVILPLFSFIFFNRKVSEKKRFLFPLFFSFLILYETVFRRSVGTTRTIEPILFWSYGEFSNPAIRQEVILNIFLFIPFGFLLSWAKKWNMAKVVLTGCIFSILIEATQYIFCLGLCEFDDVFHNTLGTALGYWYWRGLENISKKRHPHNQGEENLT